MRATVRIDDELYRQVKIRAAESGRTIGELIEDALRLSLTASPGRRRELPPLPLVQGTGVMPGVDLDNSASLRDLLDEGVPLDALR